MADLEEFFREQIKPYEERLKKLEDLDRKKDVEISLLKSAIEHMKTTIENLKAQLEKVKPNTASGKSGTSKRPETGKSEKILAKK
jgi:predicted RNase H-like nuclease (RuvC/YqgF family)